MNGCPDKAHLLQALLDGELDAENAQAAEAHLKTCPSCAAAFADLQQLRLRLADPALRSPAPAALRGRLEEMIVAESARAPRRVRRQVLPWAVSGGLGAALAASLAFTLTAPVTFALQDQLIADHVRSTLADHLVDVATSDRHTVKPWFNGHIDFAPPVTDLASQGFPLVGGRVDYLQGRVVAALVYRRNKHIINLFVRPDPGGLKWPTSDTARDGYSLLRWTEGGLEFWAVSDTEPAELRAFRDAFRAQTHG